ncbi:hypothetical protein [Streptomyces sp. SID14515]|uniref:hypothetical protein n=1 Tax=Streptomyces sp. SID14515 TaxID=2706074 RepID=UPI001944D6B8|nr:hypothetical protein [Streptomyces sp. SID14515]
MPPTVWSRRRVLTTLSAMTAVPADDFKKNLGTFALSALFFGKGRAVAHVSKKVGSSLSGIADEVGMKVSGFLEDTTTAAIGLLNWS